MKEKQFKKEVKSNIRQEIASEFDNFIKQEFQNKLSVYAIESLTGHIIRILDKYKIDMPTQEK